MKYEVGDKVKVRQGLIVDEDYDDLYFDPEMGKYMGQILTIKSIDYDGKPSYLVEENIWHWNDEMLEAGRENYTIILVGEVCETEISMELTESEYKLIQRISELTQKASICDEMPALTIKKEEL